MRVEGFESRLGWGLGSKQFFIENLRLWTRRGGTKQSYGKRQVGGFGRDSREKRGYGEGPGRGDSQVLKSKREGAGWTCWRRAESSTYSSISGLYSSISTYSCFIRFLQK